MFWGGGHGEVARGGRGAAQAVQGATPGGSHVRYGTLTPCFACCSFWLLVDSSMESLPAVAVLVASCAVQCGILQAVTQ